MQIGASPNEYTTHASNQQNNQTIARLPAWRSRLGVGTSGGGANLNSLASQNSGFGAAPNNTGLMIKALLAKQGA